MIMNPVASMKHETYHWSKESSMIILHKRKFFGYQFIETQ